MVGIGSVQSAFSKLHRDDKELSEALSKVAMVVGKDKQATIVARKPHIPYYLGVDYKFIPRVKTLRELGDYFEKNKKIKHIYLYYGAMEQRSRPQFKSLQDGNCNLFNAVTQSDKENFWVLYEYIGKNVEN